MNEASVVLPLCSLFTVPSGDSHSSTSPSITRSLSSFVYVFLRRSVLCQPSSSEWLQMWGQQECLVFFLCVCVIYTGANVSSEQWKKRTFGLACLNKNELRGRVGKFVLEFWTLTIKSYTATVLCLMNLCVHLIFAVLLIFPYTAITGTTEKRKHSQIASDVGFGTIT